jgi:hypothetical protein
VLERARAALLQRGTHDGVEPVVGDLEALAVRLDALRERPFARQLPLQLGDGVGEERVVVARRRDAVEAPRLFVEGELLPLQHLGLGDRGAELLDEVVAPQREHAVARYGDALDRLAQRRRLGVDAGEALLLRLHGLAPFRRAVIGVDPVGVVLAEGQGEFHVTRGVRVERRGRRLMRAGGEEGEGKGDRQSFHQ